jgi:gluconolactonase
MTSKAMVAAATVFLTAVFLWGSALISGQAPAAGQPGRGAQGRGQGGGEPAPDLQPSREKQVTVTAIPGVIAAGAQWQRVWQGMDNADGILALPDGSLLFAQEQSSTVRRLDARDYDSAYVKDTHGTGALAIDAQGRILGAQRTCTDPGLNLTPQNPCNEPTKIAIIYPENQRRVIADKIDGKPFGRLNDLTVHKNGTVYFNGGGNDLGTLYVKPNGQVAGLGGNIGSNGILLSPDERTLYVTSGGGGQGQPGKILAFDIAADGTPSNRRDFTTLQDGNGDGLAVDSEGRLYVTSGDVEVYSPQGKYLGSIPTPRSPITVAFGGADKKTLYIVGSGALHVNGSEFLPREGYRDNGKTIYKIPMVAQGFKGRAK